MVGIFQRLICIAVFIRSGRYSITEDVGPTGPIYIDMKLVIFNTGPLTTLAIISIVLNGKSVALDVDHSFSSFDLVLYISNLLPQC
jgi:hypothetical protein